MAQLILFNKPYRVLSQFTDSKGRATLADYIKVPGVYAAGRLDYDSEGLLLLTDDGELQHQISHPKYKQGKTYWVQVEGSPSSEAIEQLHTGIQLDDRVTRPARVKLISEPRLWQRIPPVRTRKNIPTHWLEITIVEGRNRQVRKMTASVGLPALRLIRVSIGHWHLGNLQPGDYALEKVHGALKYEKLPSSRRRRR